MLGPDEHSGKIDFDFEDHVQTEGEEASIISLMSQFDDTSDERRGSGWFECREKVAIVRIVTICEELVSQRDEYLHFHFASRRVNRYCECSTVSATIEKLLRQNLLGLPDIMTPKLSFRIRTIVSFSRKPSKVESVMIEIR